MNVLIVALDAVPAAVVSGAEVLVVAPALNSRLRRWLSDEDEARRRAEGLAATFVELLRRGGAHAEARVGDADPMLAIADALPTFSADEIVIAGRPEGLRELDALVLRMRDCFALPVRYADSLEQAA
jgi:nucleotide-binding universal stress UspA family protein